MNNKMKHMLAPILVSAALLLSGCQSTSTATSADASLVQSDVSDSAVTTVSNGSLLDTTDLFSGRDLDASYDESTAVRIQLDTASCDSNAVTIDGGTVTIGDEGVYSLSGTLDGQIVVNAKDTDKVQLVLDGVNITSDSSAAIYALKADKVFITLADGTENTLVNGGEYIAIDDSNIDSAIFAKTDLTLNGSGSLTVNAAAGHGIVSKDELVIAGGTYNITAAGHGITGKDSVAIADGNFTINSGKDGIHAESDADTSHGFLYIADGSFVVNAQGDALSASGALEIVTGDFTLTTGGGSATVTLTSDADNFGRNQWNGTTNAEVSSESGKGIKSDSNLVISGGTFSLDTADDAIHSGSSVEIRDGDFSIRSGDDAIHSDTAVTINGGSFDIPYCYEGIEGQTVTINDGVINIVSSDDGLNAAEGTDSSGMGGGQNQFAADENCVVIVNDGNITIVSDGDSIDSNGNLTINGGTLDLTCNGNGNTAIDTNGTYTNNGGTVSTNDGSESGTGEMGGGQTPGSRPGGGQTPGSGPAGKSTT